MAIQSFQLDPNSQSYTDDEIVGKVNSATANITRAGCIEGTAASALDTDDIGEGAANKYDTGVPPTDLDDLADGTTYKRMSATEQSKLGAVEENATADQTGDEMVSAINSGTAAITREDALSQDDLKIVKTSPVSGEFYVKNIQRDSSGKLDVEYDDTPEP